MSAVVAALTAAVILSNARNLSAEPQKQQIPAESPSPSSISGQGSNGRSTLELAPQPGATDSPYQVDEIPDGGLELPAQKSGASKNSVSPAPRRAYLGVTLRSVSKCTLGGELHGLEILSVDPNSPALAAGLRGRNGGIAIPNPGTFKSHLYRAADDLFSMVESSLYEASSENGDLIVAVNDQRVHTQADFAHVIAEFKPEDTIYLTVIRPGKGALAIWHRTLRIPVRLGGEIVAEH